MAAIDHRATLGSGWVDLSLLVVLAAIWGSSFSLIKIAVDTIPPATLACGRMALAAAMLTGWAWASGHRIPVSPRYLAIYAFIGLFGSALPFTLIGWGELTVDSGLAAILMGVMPIVTPVLAHFFTPDEPLRARRMAGALVGLSGLLVLIGWDALSGLGGAMLAQLAITAGAVSYAVNTIFTRRHIHIPGRVLAAGSITAGTLLLLPVAIFLEHPWSARPTAEAWLSLVLLGVLSTGVATLLYFRLVKSLGATTFSQINYLIPLMGVAWGAALLGEQPGGREAVALGLILIGIALVNRPTRKWNHA